MQSVVMIPGGSWGPKRAPNPNVNYATLIRFLIIVLGFGTTISSQKTKKNLTNS